MIVRMIVVDKFPDRCSECQFYSILEYTGSRWCSVAKYKIPEKIYDKGRPDWCPLEVEYE